MSPNNSQLHVFALAGTIVCVGGLFGATLYLARPVTLVHEPPLKELITMEVALARKSVNKTQPQKEQKAPEPTPPPPVTPPPPEPKAPEPIAKPEGVSRDETKKPADKPKDDKPAKPPKPDEKPIDISKYKRPSDDTPQTGAPTTDIGAFDGSEKGFAPLNAGDPYWRNFLGDVRENWEIPSISQVKGAPIGCFHIEPDGKVSGLKFDTPSGDETLDDSVQRAMATAQKTRNQRAQPVPTEQLGVIRKWVCFRFTP